MMKQKLRVKSPLRDLSTQTFSSVTPRALRPGRKPVLACPALFPYPCPRWGLLWSKETAQGLPTWAFMKGHFHHQQGCPLFLWIP